MFRFMGGTAVVTGAGRGIGLAFAKQLAADVYEVVGTSRNPESYGFVVNTDSRPLPLDIGSEDSIARFAAVLPDVVSKVDVLINCAGINSMSNAPFSNFAATLDDSGSFLQWDGTEHPW